MKNKERIEEELKNNTKGVQEDLEELKIEFNQVWFRKGWNAALKWVLELEGWTD